MADRNLVLQLLITAKDQASAALDKISAGISGIGGAVSSALEPLRSFGAIIAGAAGLGGANALLERAEAYTRLTNSLRVATTNEQEYQAALESVVAIAQRSNADLDSTAALYGKVGQSAKSLGINQAQVADVTELVAKAMQLSGADANTAAGGIQQLGQAFASGTLRGDEFNSVMEASPKLMEALATGLGVTVGELRSLAEAGQLTADRVVAALLTQKQAIDEVYGKLPQTVGQAMTGLANAGTVFVGQLNEQTGATQGLVAGLKFLAQNLDAVAALIGAGVTAALAKGSLAFAQQVKDVLAAKAASRELALASASQQEAAIAAAQANLAAAQAAANRALAEQRAALALQAAIEQTFGAVRGEEALIAARAQSASAAQAASAATQRYQAAQLELNAVQATATTATGLFSRAMGFLAGPGGLILLAVSAFAGLYSAFSRQKPVTDALTGSLGDYAEALKKATAAQLAAQKLEIDSQITAQKKQVDELVGSVQRQAEWLGKVQLANGNVASATDELNRRQAALDTETQKLNALTERRNALLQEQEGRQKALSSADTEAIGRYNQQATAMDKLSVAIQARAKHLKTVSDAQIEETEALLAKAEAEGRTAEVERLTLQLAQQRAAAAKIAAELLEGEATAARVKVTALENIERVQGRLTAAQQTELQNARESVAALEAQAAAGRAHAGQLEETAKNTDISAQATTRLVERLEQLREEAERDIAVAERQAEINRARIQAAIALAQAKGDEAEAASLVAQATQEEVERAQERIDQLGEQQRLIDDHIQKLYAQANADGVYDEAEREVIEALKEKSAELGKEAAILDQRLPKLEREAQQAEVMAGPIGQLTRLYAEQTKEHERAAAASDRYYDTQLKEIAGSIQVAKAKGDEAEAARLVAKQQDVLIDQAQAKAAAAQQAASDAQKTVEAYTLQAAATEGISAAEKEQIAQLQEVANTKAAAAQQATNYAETLKDETDATREKAEADKEAAEAAAEAAEADRQRAAAGKVASGVLNQANNAIQELGGNTEALTEEFNRLQRQFSTRPLESWTDWMKLVNRATDDVKNAFEGQKDSLESLIERYEGFANGTMSASEAQIHLGESAYNALNGFSLLNKQDLSRLRSAIDSANAKLKQMQEETRDARFELQSLNAELLEEQGLDEKAEKLRAEIDYQERLADIEKRRQEAELSGNSELVGILNEQAATLSAIYSAKLANIAADKEAETAGDKTAAGWERAEKAIRGAGEALKEARGAAAGVADTDLSGLNTQMNNLATGAERLRSVL